jgi:hypothetical protein
VVLVLLEAVFVPRGETVQNGEEEGLEIVRAVEGVPNHQAEVHDGLRPVLCWHGSRLYGTAGVMPDHPGGIQDRSYQSAGVRGHAPQLTRSLVTLFQPLVIRLS